MRAAAWGFLVSVLLLGCTQGPAPQSCPCDPRCQEQNIDPRLHIPGAHAFALLVGLNRYNRPISDSADLDSAESSVARIGALLCALGYHVRTLTDTDVTAANILSAMDEIMGYSGDSNGNRFLMYYVGHAVLRTDSTFALELRGNGLSSPEVNTLEMRAIFDKLMRFHIAQKVLILDACHSGDFKLGDVQLPVFPQELLQGGGFCGITTGRGRNAYENRLSRLVAEGLEGKASESGLVTTGDLVRFLQFQADSIFPGDTTLSVRTRLVGKEDWILSAVRR